MHSYPTGCRNVHRWITCLQNAMYRPAAIYKPLAAGQGALLVVYLQRYTVFTQRFMTGTNRLIYV